MKKSKIISSLALFVTAMMLSGCLVPYWHDDGPGHGGGRGGGRGGGHHDGGGRR